MPSVLTESIALELGASEPWPDDVKLYQQDNVRQILLPDSATCLAVEAFFKMCGLNYEVDIKTNSECMAPGGKLPLIKCGNFVIADFEPIVSFVGYKGINLNGHLSVAQQADMRAYISLVNSILSNAELYMCWCDNLTMEEVTGPRYGSVYPWPLNHILVWRKQSEVKKKLSAVGWKDKTFDQIFSEVDECCQALSERLNNNAYFFNNKPTELDAMVFGHLYIILTTPIPNMRFASVVRNYKNLVEFCQRIETDYFKGRMGH